MTYSHMKHSRRPRHAKFAIFYGEAVIWYAKSMLEAQTKQWQLIKVLALSGRWNDSAFVMKLD